MLIGGIQKTTLIDYPDKVACIVFTMGCNFRCGFCHNPELVEMGSKSNISEDVFFDFLKKRKKILDGVVITGGEPLLQKDIKNFIIKIKKENFLIKLDTNGTFPVLLKELIDLKLVDYVAMDVKTNVLEKYSDVVNVPRRSPLARDCGGAVGEDILKSIKILIENKVDYEFRTTVVEYLHTKEDLIEISKLIKGAPRYFLQKFVAAPKLLDKSFRTRKSLPTAELEDVCEIARRYVGMCEVR
ncbi:MAG: anaerobic ribonucleoside-triphosphate reductase activating protein [bacterium]